MSMNLENPEKLKKIIEGALLAAGRPLSIDNVLSLFIDENQPSRLDIREAIDSLKEDCAERGVELIEVSSGFRFQVKADLATWIARLWEEKPARYSRAVLETLSLIAYRQPITRSEIEDVRGVSVSSNIVKTLLEREWVRVVGHRDVPGKPALFGTTRQFLDYFGLKGLSDLPPLAEIRNIESIEHELDFGEAKSEEAAAESSDGAANDDAPIQVQVEMPESVAASESDDVVVSMESEEVEAISENEEISVMSLLEESLTVENIEEALENDQAKVEEKSESKADALVTS